MINDEYKFGLIMTMHFPNVVPGRIHDLNCKECQDFKSGECVGKGLKGDKVIDCMLVKFENSIIEVHQALIQ